MWTIIEVVVGCVIIIGIGKGVDRLCGICSPQVPASSLSLWGNEAPAPSMHAATAGAPAPGYPRFWRAAPRPAIGAATGPAPTPAQHPRTAPAWLLYPALSFCSWHGIVSACFWYVFAVYAGG